MGYVGVGEGMGRQTWIGLIDVNDILMFPSFMNV